MFSPYAHVSSHPLGTWGSLKTQALVSLVMDRSCLIDELEREVAKTSVLNICGALGMLREHTNLN